MRTRKLNQKRLSLEPLEDRQMLSAYSVVDLGFMPGDYYDECNDINNAGQVAGLSGQNATLWNLSPTRDGTGTRINVGRLSGDEIAVGRAISSNGWVAGTSVRWGTAETSASTRPFLWIPDAPNGDTGTMLALGDVQGDALGVNSQGKVVGSLGTYPDPPQAFVWERDAAGAEHLTNLNDAVPRDQLVAQGIESGVVLLEAAAINDSNQIVLNGWYGEDTDGDGQYDVQNVYAFLLEDDDGLFYDGGMTVTHLGSLGGSPYTYAADINQHGQIVGASASPKSGHGGHAFLWQDGVMSDLGTLGGATVSRARAISDNGMVVGESSRSPFLSSYDPFLWQNGRMTSLNKEIPRDSGWTLRWAHAVNDDGEVVGMGETPHTSEQKNFRGYLLSTSVTLPTLSISDVTAVEGDLDAFGSPELTPAELTVTLSAPLTEALTVDYYTAGWYGESIADEDFVSSSGSLTFQPGETSQTITVYVKGDVLAGGATHDQGDEYFTVNLIDPRNAAGEQTAVFHDAQGYVTILEDEPAMSIADIQLPEGDSGLTPFTFTVSLSVPAKADVSVDWHTRDNTAKAGVDYIEASGTLVILDGQSSGTITVQVIGDTTVEGDNPFVVILEEGTAQNAYVTDAYGYGYIQNDDGAGGGKGGGKGHGKGTNSSTASSSVEEASLVVLPTSELQQLETGAVTKTQAQGKGKGGGGGGGENAPPEPPAMTFTDGKDVFVTSFDGTDTERIVRSGGQKEGPSYSPDGSKIVYFEEIKSGYVFEDLYEAAADGSGKPQLLKSFDGSADSFPNYDSGGDSDPIPNPEYHDWTPDGETLVFRNQSDYGDLFVWRRDAPNEVQALGLADFSTWFHSVSLGPDLDGSTAGYEGWLAYTASEDGPAAVGRFDLHLVRVTQQADGSLQVDPSTLFVQRVAAEDPDFVTWSPDGSQIAYRLANSVWVADVTTTATTVSLGAAAKIYEGDTDGGIMRREAQWSPDGQWLAFSAGTGSHYDLFRIRPDGSELTQLTSTNSKDELFPSWNPSWTESTTAVASQNERLYLAALDWVYAQEPTSRADDALSDDLLWMLFDTPN